MNNNNTWNPRYNDWPPSYASVEGVANTVVCEVCKGSLNVVGITTNTVVCSLCHQETPIKPANPGSKYLRCSACQQLLVVMETTRALQCTRATCRKLLQVPSVPVIYTTAHYSTNRHVSCCHCHKIYMVMNYRARYSICPYCSRRSFVPPYY